MLGDKHRMEHNHAIEKCYDIEMNVCELTYRSTMYCPKIYTSKIVAIFICIIFNSK